MNIDENVTGITVCYNTKEYIERAIVSVRNFHPNMKIIIVDGSEHGSECYNYVGTLASSTTRVFHAERNIGHGRGIQAAIGFVETPYILTFDSDIEMLKSPLQAMLDMFEDDTYGVGYIEKTAYDGHEWGCKKEHLTQGWMRYLHPYFSLIQLKEYKKYKPFIHHGAPAVNTCLDIHNRGLGDKVIKEFPGLGHSSGKGWVWTGEPREFIRHDPAGTRNHNKTQGKGEIEGVWEKVIPYSPMNVPPRIEPIVTPTIFPTASSSNQITCITCTGDRPLAFDLCRRWMEKQLLQPYQWIVVDDGHVPLPNPPTDIPYVQYIRREPKQGEPKHTMLLNFATAVPHVVGQKIMVIEDDEYYAPGYIDHMATLLESYEIVGIGRSKYYYLPQFKYYAHDNMGHASLAQTVFRVSFLNRNKQLFTTGDSFLDLRLWRVINGSNADYFKLPKRIRDSVSRGREGYIFDDDGLSLYCGIKGLPGRKGIGSGHGNHGFYRPDPNKGVLRIWVRDKSDFDIYASLSIPG